jgi:hypothetical protein
MVLLGGLNLMTQDNAAATEPRPGATSSATAPANGPQSAAPAAGSPDAESTVQRAEALTDRLTVQAAVATHVVGQGLRRFWSRLCEEVADIWAEAQSIRRGNQS